MLGREDAGIQENQNYDEPIEDLGLDCLSAGSSHPPVHSANSHHNTNANVSKSKVCALAHSRSCIRALLANFFELGSDK